MGFFGLAVMVVGGILKVRDDCVLNRIEKSSRDRAISMGLPYYPEPAKHSCKYIPTGERCYEQTNRNGERVLVNAKTNKEVFNVTKFEQNERLNGEIKRLKQRVRETGSKYVIANIDIYKSKSNMVFLFDIYNMEIKVAYETFNFNKYKIADVTFDGNEMHFVNEKEIDRSEFNSYRDCPQSYWLKMPIDKFERMKMWNLCD